MTEVAVRAATTVPPRPADGSGPHWCSDCGSLDLRWVSMTDLEDLVSVSARSGLRAGGRILGVHAAGWHCPRCGGWGVVSVTASR